MNRERNLFLENAKCFCRCFPFSLIPISITSFDCFFQLFFCYCTSAPDAVVVIILFFASIRNIHVHICQMGVRRVEFHVFVRLVVGLKDLRNILYQLFYRKRDGWPKWGDFSFSFCCVCIFIFFFVFWSEMYFCLQGETFCAIGGLSFDENK